MPTFRRRPRAAIPVLLLVLVALVAGACGNSDDPATVGGATASSTIDPNCTFKISAIPDQDPAKLATINTTMATYLASTLGVKVAYVPVTHYAASVSLFKTGDLDMVFFGVVVSVVVDLISAAARRSLR